eukprot:878452-Rhodomonas_salina.3
MRYWDRGIGSADRKRQRAPIFCSGTWYHRLAQYCTARTDCNTIAWLSTALPVLIASPLAKHCHTRSQYRASRRSIADCSPGRGRGRGGRGSGARTFARITCCEGGPWHAVGTPCA